MPPKGWKNGKPPPGYKFADKTKESKYKTPSKKSSSKSKKATPSSSSKTSPTKTSYSISEKAKILKKLDKFLSKKGNSLEEVTLPYAMNECGLLHIGDTSMRRWMDEKEFIFAAVDCGLGDKTMIQRVDRDIVEAYMDTGVLPESSDEEDGDEEEEDFFNEEEDNNDDEAYGDDEEVDITDITEDEVDRILSNWPVALFIPNLLGYLRIILSFIGFNYALQSQPNIALNIWIVAALLDCIDGMAARILNQCSEFGVLLDIIADNTLRTTIWISAIIEAMKSGNNDMSSIGICIWVSIICLEWLTMFCTQSKEDDAHWKDMTGDDVPFFVKLIFTNNFRGAGAFAIYGLFVAPIGSYVSYVADQTWLVNVFAEDYLANLVLIAYVGRFTTIMVELWICKKFMKDVIAEEPVIVGGVPIILGAPEKED